MVARGTRASDDARRLSGAASRAAASLFMLWRLLLTRLWRALALMGATLGEAGRRPVAAATCLGRFVVHPADVFASPRARRGLAAAGVASLVAGLVLSLAAGPYLGLSTAQVLVAAGWTLVWAFARLAILLLALPADSSAQVRLAWAAGLVPAVFGIADPLRLLAFAVSAWLTFGALVGAGTPRASARRAVAWAWGAEATGWVLRWLASGFLYVLGTRG